MNASNPSPAKGPVADKYIIVLEDGATVADLDSVAAAVDQSLVSSAELGSELGARQVYARGEGIYFKNLNVAVVDNLDLRLAANAIRGTSPVVHVERERIFRALATRTATVKQRTPSPESKSSGQVMAELAALRQNLLAMQHSVDGLEELLRILPDDDLDGIDRGGAISWGLRAIGWPQAGRLTGRGARVAVLDTGIDPGHPSFAGRALVGKTFVDVAWDDDRHGHGTHCAGTVAGGRTQDGANVAFGVAPMAELYIGRVLDARGSGTTSGIVDAIDWALEKGCQVVSMSLGAPVRIGEAPSLVYERVGERALAQGCILVAAAGNESRRPSAPPQPVGSPANARSILAVGAVDERRQVASFSNGGINAGDGGAIDVVAPGVGVLSAGTTLAEGRPDYVNKSGTSMATPHVAGIAALLLEQDATRTGQALWDTLTAEALPLPGTSFRDVGAGLCQVPQP